MGVVDWGGTNPNQFLPVSEVAHSSRDRAFQIPLQKKNMCFVTLSHRMKQHSNAIIEISQRE